MAAAYVVLAPEAGPDYARPLAFFIVDSEWQGAATAQTRAAAFKTSNSPTSPDPIVCVVDDYDVSIPTPTNVTF